MRDFSLSTYMALMDRIAQKGLPVFGVSDWLKNAPKRGVVIRHDVDRRPGNALEMARAEHAVGIKTTYYFRVVGSANNPDIIRSVFELGHEVGYHYEDLALVNGRMNLAAQSFAKHLAYLRSIVPVRTVAMHGSPMSRYNNLDIWKVLRLDQHDLEGEAFLSIDYSGAYYFTDTGRNWNSITTNLRDRPAGALQAKLGKSGTRGLDAFIENNPVERIALSVHPERWDDSVLGWGHQLAKDLMINSVKRVLGFIRSPSNY